MTMAKGSLNNNMMNVSVPEVHLY